MMKNRYIYCSILLLLLSFTFLEAKLNLEESITHSENSKNLEGVYEFISQEINTVKPKKESLFFSIPEWKGIWQINNGYFSSVLMKDFRNKFFDCKDQDLGYESFAGTYILENDNIIFKQNYSLHPFYKGRPVVMKYKVEGDTLILIQILNSTIEDTREGTIKITLKRLD